MPPREGIAPSVFSKPAVQRAVLRQTATHPTTIYPAVLAALGGLAVLLFGPTSLLLWGASGAACLGLSSWLVNYIARKNVFAGVYLERAYRQLEAQTRERLELLRHELDELGLERGVQQLETFQATLANLKAILQRVLDVSELTYGRYLGISEQVYLAGIDNLAEAALGLRSVRAIDLEYIDTRIDQLEKSGAAGEESQQELASLRARRELHAEQLAKVSELLARNEAAITEMDRTAAAIAAIRTGPRSARIGFEAAMAELARLAEGAQRYSNSS